MSSKTIFYALKTSCVLMQSCATSKLYLFFYYLFTYFFITFNTLFLHFRLYVREISIQPKVYLQITDSYTGISKNLSALQIFKISVGRIVPSTLFRWRQYLLSDYCVGFIVLRQFICTAARVTMAAPAVICRKTVQDAVIRFLRSEAMSNAYIYQRLYAHYGESVLSRSVFEWTQKFKDRKSVMKKQLDTRPHPRWQHWTCSWTYFVV